MKKIRLFHNAYASPDCMGFVKSWNIVSGNNTKYNIYKDLEFVYDESYEYAIFLDVYNSPIKNIPIKNIVGYYGEPYEICNLPEYIKTMKGTFGTFYVPSLFNNESCFKEGMSFIPPCPYEYKKQNKIKKMSIIASNKRGMEGYEKRHFIIKKILESNLDIDIYGRGLEHMYSSHDKRMKGAIEDKSTGIIDYKFSIAIENSKYNCYSTEKIYDCLLRDTIPLYWGCKKVKEVLDERSYILLPDDNNQCWELVKDVYHNEPFRDTFYAANQLKESYNWLEHVWKHFNQ